MLAAMQDGSKVRPGGASAIVPCQVRCRLPRHGAQFHHTRQDRRYIDRGAGLKFCLLLPTQALEAPNPLDLDGS